MKKKLKKKLKRITLLVIAGIVVGLGLMVWNLLGPWRGLFWNLPYLAGFFGPRNYLVLIQNNNELRPTGGFITAVADVRMLFGVPSIDVKDSYSIPNPEPRRAAPEPFVELIGRNDPFFAGWTLRDANFSPDFRVSAQDVLELAQAAYPSKDYDAVVAVDFSIVEALLSHYGPLTIDDHTFTDESFFGISQRISKDIDTHNKEALASRKNVLKPFLQALISKIIKQPTRYGVFLDTLYELGQEKHLLVYARSDSLQERFRELNLTQELQKPREVSDSVHVNIANIGGRKADRYLSKDIQYLADFSDPSGQSSRLTITLEHFGSYNIQSDVYQAYIRSYVPLNASLISTSGQRLKSTQVFSDLEYTVFADYVRLNPGERRVITYTYRLPEEIQPENYRLKVFKQPGLRNQHWRIVNKQLNDSTLMNAAPLPEQSTGFRKMDLRENLAFWQGVVESDLHFHLVQNLDQFSPIVQWQRFESLERVNIRFSEQLENSSATNPANYQIIDKNVSNPTTDTVVVESVEYDGRDLWLTISGANFQFEEQYQLLMKDITDLHGNLIEPNPLERTLVQRIESSSS